MNLSQEKKSEAINYLLKNKDSIERRRAEHQKFMQKVGAIRVHATDEQLEARSVLAWGVHHWDLFLKVYAKADH